MGLYESIDELVDEILKNKQETNIEIEKQKAKPFRYIKNKEEIQKALTEKEKTVTVMKNPNKKELFNEDIFQVSLGDIEKIEDIIKKHQISRKL